MRATCISNDSKTLADHQQGRAVSFESNYSLTVGKRYLIVGMAIVERAFFFLVQDDTGGPCFAHAGFFELFTAVVPAGWRFRLEAGINASGKELWSEPGVAIWGYSELVDDPEHVDALFELYPGALALFESYLAAAGADG